MRVNKNKQAARKRVEAGLTKQDLIIIKMICLEMTSAQIGVELGKSSRTIDGCRLAIMKILGVRSVVGIVKWAIKEGVVKI